MTAVPSISWGAIAAAVIAGVISLIGLIISKEQKTSEFRQAWIDALRDDLGTYLTQIRCIGDGSAVKYASLEKKVQALSPFYASLNKATYSITLRLNPEEPHAQEVLKQMTHLGTVMGNPVSLKTANIQPHEIELLAASKKLLNVNRRPKGTPYRRAIGTPSWGSGLQ